MFTGNPYKMQFPCGRLISNILFFILLLKHGVNELNINNLTSLFLAETMRISRHKRTLNGQFAATNAELITGPGWALQAWIPAPTRSQETILQHTHLGN